MIRTVFSLNQAVPAVGGGPTSSTGRRLGLAATVRGFAAGVALGGSLLCSPAASQQAPPLVVTPMAEKRVSNLPPGPLFWLIENFPSVAAARTAEGPTGLVVEAAGRVWLFTVGPAGGASPGAARVAEVGPIAEVRAPQYLLRINQASGPPGSITPAHTHPGSEAGYVVAGETSQRTPHGTVRVGAGQAMPGHGADVPMQVSSSGSTDLLSLVMFVVDATRPFSSPSSMQ